MNARQIIIALGVGLASGFAANTAAQESPEAPAEQTPEIIDEKTPTPSKAEVPERSAEERVVFLLSGYEYFPTRADLDAVAPAEEISALLRAMAEDEDRRPTQRLRAVDALGHYDDEVTVELLTRIATSAPKKELRGRKARTANLLQHHAITSLAKSLDEEAVPALTPLLDSDDLQIQLTVIHALGKHGGKPARTKLAALKRRTDNSVIRRELARWVE